MSPAARRDMSYRKPVPKYIPSPPPSPPPSSPRLTALYEQMPPLPSDWPQVLERVLAANAKKLPVLQDNQATSPRPLSPHETDDEFGSFRTAAVAGIQEHLTGSTSSSPKTPGRHRKIGQHLNYRPPTPPLRSPNKKPRLDSMCAAVQSSEVTVIEYGNQSLYPPVEQGDTSLTSTLTIVPSITSANASCTFCESSSTVVTMSRLEDGGDWNVLPMYNNYSSAKDAFGAEITQTSVILSWWKHAGTVFANRLRSFGMVIVSTFTCR